MIVLAISFAVFAVLTVVLIHFLKPVIARLPADYFVNESHAKSRGGSLTAKVTRNVVAAAILIVGLILIFPGVPGPGFLLILVALIVGDFPFKYQFLRWMASLRVIREWLNKTRTKYGQPPFEM